MNKTEAAQIYEKYKALFMMTWDLYLDDRLPDLYESLYGFNNDKILEKFTETLNILLDNGVPKDDEQTLAFLAMIYECSLVDKVEQDMNVYAHIEGKEVFQGTMADLLTQYAKYLGVDKTE